MDEKIKEFKINYYLSEAELIYGSTTIIEVARDKIISELASAIVPYVDLSGFREVETYNALLRDKNGKRIYCSCGCNACKSVYYDGNPEEIEDYKEVKLYCNPKFYSVE